MPYEQFSPPTTRRQHERIRVPQIHAARISEIRRSKRAARRLRSDFFARFEKALRIIGIDVRDDRSLASSPAFQRIPVRRRHGSRYEISRVHGDDVQVLRATHRRRGSSALKVLLHEPSENAAIGDGANGAPRRIQSRVQPEQKARRRLQRDSAHARRVRSDRDRQIANALETNAGYREIFN